MDDRKMKSISKFLSLVLRHKPETIGITLDDAGWTEIDDLLARCSSGGKQITRELLEMVVQTNDKKRFEISEDGRMIRASQGHSLEVELGYEPKTPPEILYHGTATKNFESIRLSGIQRGKRHHVHLSSDPSTATNVGQRYGKPVILIVHAGDMAREGKKFGASSIRE